MGNSARVGRPAAFLDRDGTISEDVEFIRDPSEVCALAGAAQAIRLLRDVGYLIVVITNQSGVARGYLTEETLGVIHRELNGQLAAEGASFDAVYYCPHLPDGEEEPYARECNCRKPAPGLLLKAAEEWQIDLARSVMIGNAERDVEAGRAAGCRTALLAKEPPAETVADVVVPTLLDAARWAVKQGGAL